MEIKLFSLLPKNHLHFGRVHHVSRILPALLIYHLLCKITLNIDESMVNWCTFELFDQKFVSNFDGYFFVKTSQTTLKKTMTKTNQQSTSIDILLWKVN